MSYENGNRSQYKSFYLALGKQGHYKAKILNVMKPQRGNEDEEQPALPILLGHLSQMGKERVLDDSEGLEGPSKEMVKNHNNLPNIKEL